MVTDLKRYQSVLLEVLIEFDRVCRDSGVFYSLDSGTLIGAIRHQGFIPWDDDIDVIMTRENYEKFIRNRSKLSDRFDVISLDTNNSFTAPLAKMYDKKTKLIETGHRDQIEIGAYIDLFVLDYVPNSLLGRNIMYLKAYICRRIWGFSIYKPRTPLKMEKWAREFFFRHHIGRKASMYLEKTARKQKRSNYLCRIMYTNNYKIDTFNSEIADQYIEVDFEGRKFWSFKEYHYILTQMYGDYMQLPPESERVPVHEIFIEYNE